jgi:hypothetical protein
MTLVWFMPLPFAGLAPAAVVLAADAGAFSPFSGEYVGMAGVGVAPPQVGVQRASERDVVGVGGVGQHEGAQRAD